MTSMHQLPYSCIRTFTLGKRFYTRRLAFYIKMAAIVVQGSKWQFLNGVNFKREFKSLCILVKKFRAKAFFPTSESNLRTSIT
jgi:hypothetical protein